MTTEQFEEQQKLLEKMNRSLNEILPLFNLIHKLARFLGSEKQDGILQEILEELRKE